MTLHLIQRSPFSHSALQDCLNIIHAQDSVLLMEDGVYGVQHSLLQNRPLQPSQQPSQWPTYALQADVSARGLSSQGNIKEIDYCEFVKLCCAHQHVISWY